MNDENIAIYEAVEKRINSKDIEQLSYAKMLELRREFLDTWSLVKDTLFHENRWENTLVTLSHIIQQRKDSALARMMLPAKNVVQC